MRMICNKKRSAKALKKEQVRIKRESLLEPCLQDKIQLEYIWMFKENVDWELFIDKGP